MKNFDLIGTDWVQVNDLIAGSTYLLTAKRAETLAGSGQFKDFYPTNILVAIASSVPAHKENGTLCQGIKFKKNSNNVYIRATKLPCNITIQEV